MSVAVNHQLTHGFQLGGAKSAQRRGSVFEEQRTQGVLEREKLGLGVRLSFLR